MTKDEALKLALEALTNAIAVRNGEGGTKLVSPLEENAITAIKEALAQPEQKPVGKFAKFTDGIWREVTDGSACVPLYTTPPAQRKETEQEPVAWISTGPARMIYWESEKPAFEDDWVPLYTTPPAQRKETEQEPVQVSPIEFVSLTFGRGHLVGKPAYWAEWPTQERNT